MTVSRSWRGLAAAAVVAVLAILASGGCSSSRESKSTSGYRADQDSRTGAAVAPPAGGTGQPAATPGGGQPGGGQPARAPAADQRSIIYTGTVTVRVSDVDAAADAAVALASGAGGFVAGDDRTRDASRSQAKVVLRVPSTRFGAVVDGVARLGTEKSRQLSTQDVTDRLVDLDARVATAQASVDRVRALLAKAQTISEIVSLESELSRREADLESLRAQQRKLADLTALSTVTAVLLGPQAPAAGTTGGSNRGFLAGLRAGWHAFVTSLQVLLTVLGAALPWLIAIGVPLAAVLWLTRRLRANRPAPAGTAGWTPGAVTAGVAGPAGTGTGVPAGPRVPAPGGPAVSGAGAGGPAAPGAPGPRPDPGAVPPPAR